MGTYNLVPKKKTKAVKQMVKAGSVSSGRPSDLTPDFTLQHSVLVSLQDCGCCHDFSLPVFSQKDKPKASAMTSNTAGDHSGAQPQTEEASEQTECRMEVALVEGAGSVEYTELALDCLDLKAQEELLSPLLSGDENSLVRTNSSDVNVEDFFSVVQVFIA